MEDNSRTTKWDSWTKYAQSPTLIFSSALIVAYIIVGALVGNFSKPIQNSAIVDLLAQCDISQQNAQGGYSPPFPVFPWTLVTSIFLHASILHIASNVLFLLLFGFILEERVSKPRWVTAFLLTGLMGNLTSLAADLTLFFASGVPVRDCGVGASGAVYGMMGTALGLRATILIIFIASLDLFAGGGFFAHFGGLVTGIVLRWFWAREPGVI